MAKGDFGKTRAAACTTVDLSGNQAHEAFVGSCWYQGANLQQRSKPNTAVTQRV